MKSYSDLKEDLEQRRKELQAKQKKQIEDRKDKSISYRDVMTSNMEKEKKKQEKMRQQEAERKQSIIAREKMKQELKKELEQERDQRGSEENTLSSSTISRTKLITFINSSTVSHSTVLFSPPSEYKYTVLLLVSRTHLDNKSSSIIKTLTCL